MGFIIRWLVSAIIIFLLARFLPGIHITGYLEAIIVAAVLGLLHLLIKPILFVLTLPVTLLTFGLFLFVLNAFMVLIADYLLTDFEVDGFWWALLFSIVLSLAQSIMDKTLD